MRLKLNQFNSLMVACRLMGFPADTVGVTFDNFKVSICSDICVIYTALCNLHRIRSVLACAASYIIKRSVDNRSFHHRSRSAAYNQCSAFDFRNVCISIGVSDSVCSSICDNFRMILNRYHSNFRIVCNAVFPSGSIYSYIPFYRNIFPCPNTTCIIRTGSF